MKAYLEGCRPIKPTSDASVRIQEWTGGTEFTQRFPWKVLTMYAGEPGYTLVGSFDTKAEAEKWAKV